MPMERSVSCAERGAAYGRAPPQNDLRCHSASYPASYAPAVPPANTAASKVQRAGSTGSSSWSRAANAVQRSGSTRSVSAGPTPGLNLRCYSASYAASYRPFSADGAAAAQVKPAHSTGTAATWSSAGRRSLNLRGYTPSFAALVDDDNPHRAPPPAKATPANPGGGGLDDAELQRKKRLVAYKVYDVEGKVKVSVRRGVKWIKGKYSRAVHGW